jgi:pantoate--beta-alanine ligase
MEIFHSPVDISEWSHRQRQAGQSIGFVPTMGALHEGHAALMKNSNADNTCNVASIFVNPLQFNSSQDLASYPRTFDADTKIAQEAGIDALYVPSVSAMYPDGFSTAISAGSLSDSMEGAHRPGHFDGVSTVVVKLLNAVNPHTAYFGEKDFQQLAVVRRVVADLNINCRIIGVPTIRHSDGLAMSSRNVRLTPIHRQQSPVIYSALQKHATRSHISSDASTAIKQQFTEEVQSTSEGRVEYIEIVKSDTLEPSEYFDRSCTICVAVWFGDVRLIDNISRDSNHD